VITHALFQTATVRSGFSFARLPRSTAVISIGQRTRLNAFHRRHLALVGGGE
jgi:ABC-type uncharacterized transport system fused permease/ATPase subunit